MTEREEGTPLEASPDDPSDLGVAFGPTFLEKFLLALIAAHPNVDGTQRKRLDDAMKALVGRKSLGLPPLDDPEDEALLLMAREHHRDRCARFQYQCENEGDEPARSNEPKIRSAQELAAEAAKRLYPKRDANTHYANVNRLRERFTGVYQRKLHRDPDVDYKGTYLYRANMHDQIRESVDHQGLKRLRDEFAKWDVPMEL